MPYFGNLGSIAFSGSSLVNIKEWSMDATIEEVPATIFGDIWEESLAGRTDVSVSCAGFAQKTLDIVGLVGTDAALVLGMQSTGGPAFTVTKAILESITETVPVDDFATLSYSFMGNTDVKPAYSATSGIAAAVLANTYHGKTSKIVTGVPFTDIQSWSITINAALHDVTALHASNTGILRAAGLKSATATVVCLKSTGDREMTEGTEYTIELHRSPATVGDGSLEGDVLCTGVSLGVNVDGVEIITYNLKFIGEVSHVTT